MRELSSYNLDQIEEFLINYARKGLVRTEHYAKLLKEREARFAAKGELDLYKSLALLKDKARRGEYCSYGELAAASGMAWSHTVRARMSGPRSHLDRLLDLCRHQALPLLTSLVVNKQHLATGELDAFSLEGFVSGARRIGESVADGPAFLRQCQQDCFTWGASRDGS